MEGLTAAIMKLFDDFDFPKEVWLALLGQQKKIEWFRHTRTEHGTEYDIPVRERRVFYRHQPSSTVQAATVNQLVTTDEFDREMSDQEWKQAMQDLLDQFITGKITFVQYKTAQDVLIDKRPQ